MIDVFEFVGNGGQKVYINVNYIVSLDGHTLYVGGNTYTKFKYELSDEEIERLKNIFKGAK